MLLFCLLVCFELVWMLACGLIVGWVAASDCGLLLLRFSSLFCDVVCCCGVTLGWRWV